MQDFSQLHAIFDRTRGYINRFMSIIQPIVDAAQDEHTRLYYHHILEEEEQRLGRLEQLVPHLEELAANQKSDQLSDRELSRLLSDINLERFGLHNFREHLELSLYEFRDEETRLDLDGMREKTHADYLLVKDIMSRLSERFSDVYHADLTDHDEGHDVHQVDHLKASAGVASVTSHPAAPASVPGKKGLTVGSLKGLH
ncbi:IMEF encapsulin system ferritin-like cargo protein [Brevibacillus sp. GCM10020057]|uniref:IMEF encapsulin system ferritin-like cargo protein n=1 Tax=Brevibacillus sp. GCM10020057 TaxID=3317327 RepID=UPI003644C30E